MFRSNGLAAILISGLIGWTALAAPPAPPPSKKAPEVKDSQNSEVVVPKGSADYTKMLAAVVRYKKGELTFEQLKQLVVAAKLPPHSLGCAYVIAPVPMPPPGTPFDPALMPRDWEHTFGEVAMTHWAGKLTREEYDRLHEAAHRSQPGYPNCGRPKR